MVIVSPCQCARVVRDLSLLLLQRPAWRKARPSREGAPDSISARWKELTEFVNRLINRSPQWWGLYAFSREPNPMPHLHTKLLQNLPPASLLSALCSSCWRLTIWMIFLAQAEETLGIPEEVVHGYCQHVVVPAVGCVEHEVVQLGLFLQEFPALFYSVGYLTTFLPPQNKLCCLSWKTRSRRWCSSSPLFRGAICQWTVNVICRWSDWRSCGKHSSGMLRLPHPDIQTFLLAADNGLSKSLSLSQVWGKH